MLTSIVVSLRLHAFEWDAARACIHAHIHTHTNARTLYKHKTYIVWYIRANTPHSELRTAAEKYMCLFNSVAEFTLLRSVSLLPFDDTYMRYVECWMVQTEHQYVCRHHFALWFRWFHIDNDTTNGDLEWCECTCAHIKHSTFCYIKRSRISPFYSSFSASVFTSFPSTFLVPFIIPRVLFLKFEINVVAMVVCLEPVSYIFVPLIFLFFNFFFVGYQLGKQTDTLKLPKMFKMGPIHCSILSVLLLVDCFESCRSSSSSIKLKIAHCQVVQNFSKYWKIPRKNIIKLVCF